MKNTEGYLVTQDVRRYDEGVSMDCVLGIANKSNAKNKIIILDCTKIRRVIPISF
jgi:hypothetical protein